MKLRIFIISIITILIATACNFTLDVGLEEEVSNQDEFPVPSSTVVIPTNTIIPTATITDMPTNAFTRRCHNPRGGTGNWYSLAAVGYIRGTDCSLYRI
jgi:hypothetical protein